MGAIEDYKRYFVKKLKECWGMKIIKKIIRLLGRKPTKKEYPKFYLYFKKKIEALTNDK